MKLMARAVVLTAGLVLLSGFQRTGGAPIRVMTYSAGKEAQEASLARCMEAAIGREIERLYSCVELSTASATAPQFGDAARQKLRSGDVSDREWPALVGGGGVRYVVATRVTRGDKSVAVAANLVRTLDGEVVTGMVSRLERDARVAGECQRFAQDFAGQLRYVPGFSSDSCPPPAGWTGTVTIEQSVEEVHEETWGGGDAEAGKRVEEHRSRRRAVIEVAGAAATARDSAVGLIRTEVDSTGRQWCGAAATRRWETWRSTRTEQIESVAVGSAAAQVGASLGEGKIHLRLFIAAVPKKTTITRRAVYQGVPGASCPIPAPVETKAEAEAAGVPYSFSFDAPAGKDPNRQSGVWAAPKNERTPSARTTISWNLTRAAPAK